MPTLSHCPSRLVLAALLALGLLASAAPVRAQSLTGSKASLVRQNRAAREHHYSYLRTTSQVNQFVRRGLLVRVPGNSSYRVADVSFPYARPEVKMFLERLGKQYRNACGERLVVTSLTRPTSRQPSNASPLSVHPTGMAVDLRRSSRPACRAFLEKTLLTLEGRGVLEATRESRPPHYHVSLFPAPYMRYVVARGGAAPVSGKSYRVRGGDSLWEIAKRHGTSVERIKRANNIRSSRLKPGQVIAIPAT